MEIVFFSPILNAHQCNVADELWELTGHKYCFVELLELQGDNKKGDIRDYSTCPYLLRAWESQDSYNKAMKLAQTADCCVFSGLQALPFQKERMKKGLLSFDMSERWLKQGFKNLFSPAIFKMFLSYKLGRWDKKPLYKLCCSAFAAKDHSFLGMYKNKCYKWGYFTNTKKNNVERSQDVSTLNVAPLMWCSRYLMWKHPELPILMASKLKEKGYQFILDMYGAGEYEEQTRQLVRDLNLEDVVRFFGNKPNNELMNDMRNHDVFLFTSDRNEGWGAVANESMSCGCVLVAGNDIGSTPYLVKDSENGLVFTSAKTSSSFNNVDYEALDSLCEKVEWLLDNPEKMRTMQQKAVKQMTEVWNPQIAAKRLMVLVEKIQNGMNTTFTDGPCSMA
ncbi:MAG: glycosyltransferase [Bacteroidales bacterium]|nr:glycosyltransferase [Bacteroidales bacterium]